MRSDRSSMEATAASILSELTHAEAGSLVAAVCAFDDGPRDRIVRTLSAAGIEVAVTGPEPRDLLAYTVDVIVCVIGGRDGGVTSVRALRARTAHTQLVLIGQAISRPRLRRMLDLGADGFVLESQLTTTLVPAVRAACSGLVCVPTDLSQNVERGALTRRQREVLRLAALGRGNAEIARALYLSESTVKAHLSAAFAKVGVRSRSEASALMLDPDMEQTLGVPGLASAADL